MLEKILESPLDCMEIQPVHPNGNQSWIFMERTDTEAETPMLWPPDTKNWLLWKDPDAGENWGQEEKGTTVDEMVRRHHWLNGHEFEKTLGVGDEQGGLACCSPWGLKESDMTEWLNWTEYYKKKNLWWIHVDVWQNQYNIAKFYFLKSDNLSISSLWKIITPHII